MPEVEIKIGGRAFEVACQEGEEHYLQSAARMLDQEASVLTEQIGRLPEARMLLMAGLMLADKTAGLEDKLNDVRAKLAQMESELDRMKNTPAPEPTRIEVPVVPEAVTESLAELAARAEALAAEVEDKAAG
ncbi:cell division protein ZapA [Rhodalgimonas zhirmunskyi]|uniref:Cell division protein ZapA n=1 Tax=Rhodalgimonas zhirmunskyi TaxID=2964767 RepID=A0AAJ1UCY3_9RHOB|nr:cell division protein ZapA [Rhodoalgimonas zhirmunskyi]MDQ2095223.1 cell division protein ZapA [Rhodoalgimonas zhirmunskyi]